MGMKSRAVVGAFCRPPLALVYQGRGLQMQITRYFHKSYEITCHLSCSDAVQHVTRLLSEEGVKFVVSNSRIISTETPLVLLSFQPRLYTQKTWVGLNPFGRLRQINGTKDATRK